MEKVKNKSKEYKNEKENKKKTKSTFYDLDNGKKRSEVRVDKKTGRGI